MVKRICTALAALSAIGLTLQSANATPGANTGINVDGQAPYKAGEFVFVGPPDDVPADFKILRVLPNAGLTVVAAQNGSEARIVQELKGLGHKAELNRLVKASFAPNDSYYPLQWNFKAVQSEQAWDLSDGNGVLVAVLDTGLNAGGADSIYCVDPAGYDIVNQDPDPFDGNGHGTHVAGTIGQSSDNALGAAGLAHKSCILPVKVLGDDGLGTMADVAEGIYYAVNSGAQVINMSLAIEARYKVRNDSLVDPALDYAYANAVTVVCAAGNESSKSNVGYPAIYKTTISVGASDAANNAAYYSNGGDGLDLLAPGGDLNRDLNGDGYGDGILQEVFMNGSWGYWFFEGTSMASPHVAAAAAMLISYGTASTPDEVYAALTSTALDLDKPGFDRKTGFGLLQIHDALLYDNSTPPPPQTCQDSDLDGWCVSDGDCNDNNPNVYPGHQDTKGKWGRDGIDNDCNGVIDG